MKIYYALTLIALIALAGCIIQVPNGLNETENSTIEEPTVEELPVETPAETPVEETSPNKPEPVEEQNFDSSLPRKEVKEGELVSFPNLKAVDPDGDPITYTFTAPLNLS